MVPCTLPTPGKTHTCLTGLVGVGQVRALPRPRPPPRLCTRQLSRALPSEDPLFSPSPLFSALDRALASDVDVDLASGQARDAKSRPAVTERTFTDGRGRRAWHSEEAFERATPGGGYARSFRSSTVVVWGVEPPTAAPLAGPGTPPSSFLSVPIVLAALALGAYAAVARSFARAAEAATTYRAAYKWPLALLWPVLALVSSSFRRQLRSALVADREGRVVVEVVDQAPEGSATPGPPPPTARPSETAGGRTTADSSLRRPDRWETQ